MSSVISFFRACSVIFLGAFLDSALVAQAIAPRTFRAVAGEARTATSRDGVPPMTAITSTRTTPPLEFPIRVDIAEPSGLRLVTAPATPPGSYTVEISGRGPAGGNIETTLQVTVDAVKLSPAAIAARPPVILLNGFQPVCLDTASTVAASVDTFGQLASVLQTDGVGVAYFNNCFYGDIPIEQLAGQLNNYLAGLQFTDGTPVTQVDLVVHSMGGLIARAYLAGKGQTSGVFSPPANPKVRKLVAIATPHFGSFQAGYIGTQESEMALGNQFLWDLATWNQGQDDLRGVDALAIIGNAGTYGTTSNASDGVVSLTSGSLGFVEPDMRTRIVPYCHVTPGFLTGLGMSCANNQGIADINNASHLSAQIVRSFLADTTAWQSIGNPPSTDPFLSRYGGALLALKGTNDVYFTDLTAVSFDSAAGSLVAGPSNAIASLYYSEFIPGGPHSFSMTHSNAQVTTGTGTIATGSGHSLMFKFGPVITAVQSATAGLPGLTVASGSNITVNGVGFSGAGTQLTANGAALSISSLSDQQMTAFLPAGYNGLVLLKVTNANGQHTVNIMTTPAPQPSISLSASQTSFSYTLGGSAPASQSVNITNAGGGTLAWSATSGSSWLTVSPSSGVGSGTLTLGINTAGLNAQTYNGTITVTASGAVNSPQAISVVLTVNAGTCTYALGTGGQAFTAQGGTVTITITTEAGCPWTVGKLPVGVVLTSAGSGTGNGSVTFQVAPIGFFSSFTIAGQTFTVAGPPTGALAHFTAGGIWTTGFFVINRGSSAAQFSIAFHDDNGNPVALPFSTGSTGTLSGTVAAQGSAYYEASDPLASVVGGSAQITADPSIVVQSLFRENSAGTYYEAAVPSSSGSHEFLLPFDATTFAATGQPFYTGVAIANLDSTMSNVVCTARDSSGGIIPSAISVPPLAPQGHWANYLFPALTNNRGTIDCVSNTNIAATALRFIGTNAFSSLPVIANPANFSSGPNPVLPHFASGGIWTTGFFVLNKGSAAAHFSIAFHDDNGNPVALPFSTGSTGTLSGTVAAQGLAYYEASNPQASVAGGSAQITADPSIVVQALFRENSTGTYYEAAVPSSSGSKEFLLPFDASTFPANGQPFYTGFAIANLDATTSNVVCTARDSSGNIIPGAISVPPLAPQGHWANYLFPILTGNRGTIDCVSNTNIAATALRFIGTNAFSSLPVITK
jgi:pimeloyl-ACP methyl ester carboxylesterase